MHKYCDAHVHSVTGNPLKRVLSHILSTVVEAEPVQKSWRELGAERQSVRFADKQSRMSAPSAIDLHEIARPEILDGGRIEGHHLQSQNTGYLPALSTNHALFVKKK